MSKCFGNIEFLTVIPATESLNSHSIRLLQWTFLETEPPSAHKLPSPMCYIERISCSRTIKPFCFPCSPPACRREGKKAAQSGAMFTYYTKPTKCAPVYIRSLIVYWDILRTAMFDLYSGRWTACAERVEEGGKEGSQGGKEVYRLWFLVCYLHIESKNCKHKTPFNSAQTIKLNPSHPTSSTAGRRINIHADK